MKKELEKISFLYKIKQLVSNRKIIVFLICLLIATGLWFLNALNKNVTTLVTFPVKYVNLPENQYISNNPVSKLNLKLEGRGFSLLKYKLNLPFKPIVLDLTALTENLVQNNGTYFISTGNLSRTISGQLGEDIRITDIKPDFFSVAFGGLSIKRVPVRLDVTFSFVPSVNFIKPVLVEPRLVEIKGLSSLIDTISTLKTEKRNFVNIESDGEVELGIEIPSGVSARPEKVKIKYFTDKFTEKDLSIPVQVIHLPENIKIKLFPSEIKAYFAAGLSEYNVITSDDFQLYIDYDSINSKSVNLKVGIGKLPKFIQNFRFTPDRVEFLIKSE